MERRRLFGTSGIRGVVDKELSPHFCHDIALALGTTLPPDSTVCVATDTRTTRDVLKRAVVSALTSCGINVVDFGILPTPALALLTRELGFATGVMITASHNPPEFNGLKFFNHNSLGYSQAQETEIENVYFEGRFRRGKKGTLEHATDMKQTYLSFIKQKLPTSALNRQLRIVVDPGNGAASKFASDIFARMGLNVIAINDEPDGSFPGRSPEPKEDTLQGTVALLRQNDADLAICFDGDADRVVFCDKEGFLGFNEPVAFISRLIAQRTGKKKIVTTVETGNLLDLAVKDLGVEVVRGKVGDVSVAYLAQELDAALGVEQVGVYIFPELGYYPDSIFASLALLAYINDAGEIRRFFQSMPKLFFHKAKVPCPNELKEVVMTRAREKIQFFAPAAVNMLDGLRLEFPHSWLLIRASGTEPAIRLISESASEIEADSLIIKGKELVQRLVEENR